MAISHSAHGVLPLRIARYIEPFSLMVAQLAYEGAGGPEVAYRVLRYGKES